MKRITFFLFVAALVILLSGCLPAPRTIDVLSVGKANVAAFLNAFENGTAGPMQSVAASTLTLVRPSEGLNHVDTFTPQEFAAFWAAQFLSWRPLNVTTAIVSTEHHPLTKLRAVIVATIAYERSDNGKAYANTWTFETDETGKIRHIHIS